MRSLARQFGTGAEPKKFAVAYLKRNDGLVASYTTCATARHVETQLFNMGVPLALGHHVAVGYRDENGDDHIVVIQDRGNELRFAVERLLEEGS